MERESHAMHSCVNNDSNGIFGMTKTECVKGQSIMTSFIDHHSIKHGTSHCAGAVVTIMMLLSCHMKATTTENNVAHAALDFD